MAKSPNHPRGISSGKVDPLKDQPLDKTKTRTFACFLCSGFHRDEGPRPCFTKLLEVYKLRTTFDFPMSESQLETFAIVLASARGDEDVLLNKEIWLRDSALFRGTFLLYPFRYVE